MPAAHDDPLCRQQQRGVWTNIPSPSYYASSDERGQSPRSVSQRIPIDRNSDPFTAPLSRSSDSVGDDNMSESPHDSKSNDNPIRERGFGTYHTPAAGVLAAAFDDYDPGAQHCSVMCRVKEARSLRPIRVETYGGQHTPDPYISLLVESGPNEIWRRSAVDRTGFFLSSRPVALHHRYPFAREVGRTTVVRNDTGGHPIWEESFTIPLRLSDSVFDVLCSKRDRTTSKRTNKFQKNNTSHQPEQSRGLFSWFSSSKNDALKEQNNLGKVEGQEHTESTEHFDKNDYDWQIRLQLWNRNKRFIGNLGQILGSASKHNRINRYKPQISANIDHGDDEFMGECVIPIIDLISFASNNDLLQSRSVDYRRDATIDVWIPVAEESMILLQKKEEQEMHYNNDIFSFNDTKFHRHSRAAERSSRGSVAVNEDLNWVGTGRPEPGAYALDSRNPADRNRGFFSSFFGGGSPVKVESKSHDTSSIDGSHTKYHPLYSQAYVKGSNGNSPHHYSSARTGQSTAHRPAIRVVFNMSELLELLHNYRRHSYSDGEQVAHDEETAHDVTAYSWEARDDHTAATGISSTEGMDENRHRNTLSHEIFVNNHDHACANIAAAEPAHNSQTRHQMIQHQESGTITYGSNSTNCSLALPPRCFGSSSLLSSSSDRRYMQQLDSESIKDDPETGQDKEDGVEESALKEFSEDFENDDDTPIQEDVASETHGIKPKQNILHTLYPAAAVSMLSDDQRSRFYGREPLNHSEKIPKITVHHNNTKNDNLDFPSFQAVNGNVHSDAEGSDPDNRDQSTGGNMQTSDSDADARILDLLGIPVEPKLLDIEHSPLLTPSQAVPGNQQNATKDEKVTIDSIRRFIFHGLYGDKIWTSCDNNPKVSMRTIRHCTEFISDRDLYHQYIVPYGFEERGYLWEHLYRKYYDQNSDISSIGRGIYNHHLSERHKPWLERLFSTHRTNGANSDDEASRDLASNNQNRWLRGFPPFDNAMATSVTDRQHNDHEERQFQLLRRFYHYHSVPKSVDEIRQMLQLFPSGDRHAMWDYLLHKYGDYPPDTYRMNRTLEL